MTIYDYARSSKEAQQLLINEEAILIESYKDKEKMIFVYYLHKFFVEITTKNGIITENLPFKRGYKFDKKDVHALMKKNALYAEAA